MPFTARGLGIPEVGRQVPSQGSVVATPGGQVADFGGVISPVARVITVIGHIVAIVRRGVAAVRDARPVGGRRLGGVHVVKGTDPAPAVLAKPFDFVEFVDTATRLLAAPPAPAKLPDPRDGQALGG